VSNPTEWGAVEVESPESWGAVPYDPEAIATRRAQLQAEMEQERGRIGPKIAALASDIAAELSPAPRLTDRPNLTAPIQPVGSSEELAAQNFYAQQALLGRPPPTPGEQRGLGQLMFEPIKELTTKLSGQTVADALDVIKAYATQNEDLIAALGEKSREPTTAEKVFAGTQTTVGEAIDSFASPVGAFTLGIGLLPKAVQTGVAAVFAAHMGSQLPGQLEAGVEAIKAGDPESASKHLGGAALGATFTGLAGRQAVQGIREVLPRTSAAALERVPSEKAQKEAEILAPETGKEPTPAAAVPEPVVPTATAAVETLKPAAAEPPVAAEPSTLISTTPVEITQPRQVPGFTRADEIAAQQELTKLQGPGTGVGPGAAAVQEFSQAAAEAKQGAFGRLANWFKSRRTATTDQIKEAVSSRDVMAGRQWLNSPEYLFRKDPQAAPFVSNIVEAQLRHTDRSGRDQIHFKEITKGLKEENLQNVTKALRDYEATGDPTAFTARLTPEERAVAQDIRGYFDQWKQRLRNRRVENIIDALPDARGKAVQAVLKGQSLEAATKANKLRGPGREAVRLALNEIKEAQKWGIDRYVTHAEQGAWKIITEDGTTVAVAETKPDAYLKAQAYLKENPKAGPLTLDDSFNPGVDWPSQLTLPAYGKLLKQLKDSTGETAAELQAALRKTAPGIVLKPTSKYNRFLEKRHDVLKGEENIMDVLPSYIYSMWKKYELDPVLRQGRTVLPKLGTETRSAVEALLADAKGQKYISDKMVDYVMSGAADLIQNKTGFMLPVKPFAYSRGTNIMGNITAIMKLGYRPISIFMNRIGGAFHTWVKTGFKDYKKGREWIKTEEGKRLAKENEAEMGLQASFVTEGRLAKEEPWYKPLGLFQKMEHFNRPEAFGAFYIQATERLGLSGKEAIQHARNQTRFAQFAYNTASLPKIMRGPTGRLVLKFKPYLVKELEFISQLRGAEIARYITGFLLLGGPRAAIMMLRSLPWLGAIGALGALEDWLNQKAPRASRGAPGFAGVDVSAAVTPQLPRTETDWIGPALSDYLRLWNEIIQPAMRGEDKDWSDVKNWGSRTAPVIFYLTQMADAIMDEQGWVTDDRGRKQFQADRWDKAKLALGVTPLDKSIESSERRFLLEAEEIQRKNRTKWVDNLVDALQDNNSEKFQSLLEDASDYYTSTDDLMTAIRNNLKNRTIGPKERLFQRLSRASRLREMDRFFEPEESLQPEESSVP
jgi:hypothetical protein